jgi:hypothetical protein
MGTPSQLEPQPTPLKKPFMQWLVDHFGTKTILAIVSIASISLNIYKFVYPVSEPNLTYYVSPTRAAIVQQGSITNLSVKFNDAPVQGNMSSAEILIWNNGGNAIKESDIRIPIKIKTQNRQRIYIVRATPTDTNIVVNVDNRADSSELVVKWDILEQDDGFKIQMVYAGDVNLPLSVEGKIIGQKHLTQYNPQMGRLYPHYWLNTITMLSIVVFTTVFGFGFGHLTNPMQKRIKKVYLALPFLALRGVIIFSVFYASVNLINYLATPPKTPFGF